MTFRVGDTVYFIDGKKMVPKLLVATMVGVGIGYCADTALGITSEKTNNNDENEVVITNSDGSTEKVKLQQFTPKASIMNASVIHTPLTPRKVKEKSIEPEVALTPKEKEKRKKQLAYVKRFSKVAQSEMEKFKIPASITLAQGLIESSAGTSKLSKRNNNHFGVKCFSKKCKKGHCSNHSDDSHKDFFKIYKTAWSSYRDHSILLHRKERYEFLFDIPITDYQSWAHGLKQAGYATDKRYAHKLIDIIEKLELYKYDNISVEM